MGCTALIRLVAGTAAVTVSLLVLIAADANDDVDLSPFSLPVIRRLAMMLLPLLDNIELVIEVTVDPNWPLLVKARLIVVAVFRGAVA